MTIEPAVAVALTTTVAPSPVRDGALVLQGDARHLSLPDVSVDLIVTSPPYFALRQYQDEGEAVKGQIGGEETPDQYLDNLWAATREMIRVLKPTGSIWVNLGDKYANYMGDSWGKGQSIKGSRSSDEPSGGVKSAMQRWGIRRKSLLGLPWRYANGCADQLGLILRRDLVWDKPSGMPESVTDRCRTTHEYWFHFTLSPDYFADLDGLRETHLWDGPHGAKSISSPYGQGFTRNGEDQPAANPAGAMPGSVWVIPTEPLTVPDHLGIEHFAAFPAEFPRRLIAGWCPSRGTVLDPFGGTGTVAMMARAMGRIGISVDLSSDYCRLAEWRIYESGHAKKVLARAKKRRRPTAKDADRVQADLDATEMALEVEQEKRRMMEREVALLRRSGSTFGVTLEAKGIVSSVIPSKTNGLLIAAAAQLYIKPTDVVMDVTWGRGNWWTEYQHPGPFIRHDRDTLDNIDFTMLPEPDCSIDVVMFDPPYVSPGGRRTSTIGDFNDRYGLVAVPKTPAMTRDLIAAGMDEAVRVLAPGGRLMVKVGDYISSGRFQLGRHHVVGHGLELELEVLDEFVHASGTGPQPSTNPDGTPRIQVHSRRAHSFLVVFRKVGKKGPRNRHSQSVPSQHESTPPSVPSPTPSPVPSPIQPVDSL